MKECCKDYLNEQFGGDADTMESVYALYVESVGEKLAEAKDALAGGDWTKLDAAAQDKVRLLLQGMDLSARAYDRVLKVARTIADLAGSDQVTNDHVAEACTYRELDRNYWN